MSTNSSITIQKENGEFLSAYCHWDGDINGNGRILLNHYNDYDKALALISGGSMSSLGENINPNPEMPHSFEKPQENVTVYYCRDRQESYEHTKPYNGLSYLDVLTHQEQEYNYLFENNKWYVCTRKTRKLLRFLVKKEDGKNERSSI